MRSDVYRAWTEGEGAAWAIEHALVLVGCEARAVEGTESTPLSLMMYGPVTKTDGLDESIYLSSIES
jgi:hypothetical protein